MAEKTRVGFEVKTLANMLRRRVDKLESRRGIDGVTSTQGRVIGFIIRKNGEDVFQRDLEEEFSIRRSTATNILQLMERNGFIKRQSVDYDARLKKLILTEKAVVLHKEIEKSLDETEKQVTKGISDEELALFLEIIARMKENLNKE